MGMLAPGGGRRKGLQLFAAVALLLWSTRSGEVVAMAVFYVVLLKMVNVYGKR
jgi:hypothetical protein